MSALVKRCGGDGDTQPPHIAGKSEFGVERKRPDGLCPYCKKCNASRQRRWKRNNVEKVREDKRNYRISQRKRQERELNDL